MAFKQPGIYCTFLIALLLGACSGGDKPAATAAAGAPPAPEVEVITIVAGDATFTQDLPGRVQALRTAQVRARVDGVVEQRLYQEGSDVSRGTPLFRIDARSYQASADAARADAVNANQIVERYQRLLEIKAVSQQDYDAALYKSKLAEANRIKAEEDLAYANVPAPLTGHIGRAQVTEGALVSKSAGTLLATIEQIEHVYVNFSQSGADLLRLRQDIAAGTLKHASTAKAELILEDGSVYPNSGSIHFTDMAVDPSTGSVSLRAEFPNPRLELLPGMFVRIRFPEALAENVIRVPQRAVQSNTQGQFVMVVGADGKTTPQIVKTSGMAGPDFVISSGLKGGEQVIVNGLQKARPGTVVKPVPLPDAMKLGDQPTPSK